MYWRIGMDRPATEQQMHAMRHPDDERLHRWLLSVRKVYELMNLDRHRLGQGPARASACAGPGRQPVCVSNIRRARCPFVNTSPSTGQAKGELEGAPHADGESECRNDSGRRRGGISSDRKCGLSLTSCDCSGPDHRSWRLGLTQCPVCGAVGIHGFPLNNCCRASRRLTPCLAAVER
jgi:hypothetical protein